MISTIYYSVINFFKAFFYRENYTLMNFTAFLLVLMCIQYIPIETRAGVSPVKVAVMAITPIIFLRHFAFTKAFFWGTAYWLWVLFTAMILHPSTFRSSTVMYLAMFVLTYVAFYTFVYVQQVFTLRWFIKFVRVFIYVLTGVLILQQCFIIVGIKYFPLINLCQILDRGIGANSLSFEPSSLARTLLILYYAYLKCCEYRDGVKITLKQIFNPEHRTVTLLFLWSMLSMGSGTAFICLGILSLYFMRGWSFLLSVPIFIGVYFALDYFQMDSFQRARVAIVASSTGDAQQVMEADGSAAVRIKPMLNTLNLDIGLKESWFGNGCDSVAKGDYFSDKLYLSHISDYGLISYILELIIVFSCAIRFRSLATIMFFLGVGGGIGNISYGWGLLMILTVVKYMYEYGRYLEPEQVEMEQETMVMTIN